MTQLEKETIDVDGVSRVTEVREDGTVFGEPDEAGKRYRETIQYRTYHEIAVAEGRVALSVVCNRERGVSGPGYPNIAFGD